MQPGGADPAVYDLGDVIRIANTSGMIPPNLRQVRLTTPHAIIYSGRV